MHAIYLLFLHLIALGVIDKLSKPIYNIFQWKKRSERSKHCALAVVRRSQKFLPRRRPLPGGTNGQNLISWRWSLPLLTNPGWWRSMHAISSYRGNRPTHTHTHTHTHKHTNPQTGLVTIHCTAKLGAQCKEQKKLRYRWQTVHRAIAVCNGVLQLDT